MKKFIILFFIFTSVVSADENWGPAEQLWMYGSIDLLRLEPKFSPNANETIFTCDDDILNNHRIFIANDNDPWNRTLFLNDSLSVVGYDDVTPYLSFDLSYLYFSSNRPGGYGGYDIWISEWVEGDWTIPVNLGPDINSEFDDVNPSLTGLNNEIFFQRGTYHVVGTSEGSLYYSDKNNGQWTDAIELPVPVNSDYNDVGPAVNLQGTKLYFLSDRPNNTNLTRAAWVSYKENDIWQFPTILLGEVNEIVNHLPPWYGYYDSESLSLDFTGMRLLFYKTGIANGMPDYDMIVFESSLITGIDDDEINIPSDISISAYPNPFNSSVTLSTSGIESGNLTIYDLLGRNVRSFKIDQTHSVVTWDGLDYHNNECVSGIYFIKLSSEKLSSIRSVTLLK